MKCKVISPNFRRIFWIKKPETSSDWRLECCNKIRLIFPGVLFKTTQLFFLQHYLFTTILQQGWNYHNFHIHFLGTSQHCIVSRRTKSLSFRQQLPPVVVLLSVRVVKEMLKLTRPFIRLPSILFSSKIEGDFKQLDIKSISKSRKKIKSNQF